jgi:HK97 family phage major capsid protein
MSAELEALKVTIADVKAAIDRHAADSATLDKAAINTAVLEAMRAEQMVRRGDTEGEFVGPEGARAYNPVIKSGKFAGLRTGDTQFAAWLLRRAYALRPEGVRLPSAELLKASMSTTDAVGGDLVPVGYASKLWEDMFLTSQIVANIPERIAMPANPWHVPLGIGDITWRKGTQNTATTATQMATDETTLTATELVSEVSWSYTLDEDSVIAMLPALQARIKLSAAEAMDGFVYNADGTDANNINNHDAGNDSDDAYYRTDGQDGIRHQWTIDDATQMCDAGGDALTDSDLLAAMAKLGKYAVRYRDDIWVCDVSTYLAGFLQLDGVQTLDKYGTAAVLLAGELGSYRGIPIIVSAMAPNTQADGFADGAADTLGQISLVHRPSWRVGFCRDLLMEVDKSIQARQFILVNSFRIAVGCYGTRASATHTAGVYNIKVA